ncbi:MAG: hypothetical protein ACP5QT_06685 [Brevinematia bacterium]
MKRFILILIFLFANLFLFAKDNIYVGLGGLARIDRSVFWEDGISYGFSLFGEWRSLRLDLKNSYFGEREVGLRWNIEASLSFPTYFLKNLLKDVDIPKVIEILSYGVYLSPVFTFEYDNYLDRIFLYEIAFGYRFEFSNVNLGNWFLELQFSCSPFNSLIYAVYTYRGQSFIGYIF